jgi:hypothetical protein
LKNLGHQAELHNNRGVQKENLSYIIDPPKDDALVEKSTALKTDMPKMLPGTNWSGIYTATEHNPSTGEWQEKIAKN